MSRLELFSPAKINLFLHITGQRSDGYHELQTVFQLLDYGDDISLRQRDDGEITLSPALAGVDVADNLMYKAARLLQAHTQQEPPQGADISFTKRLPMGGGLGGGSSNAATVLVGLNHLWQLGLSTDELAHIGLSLGADVPVFVRGFSAWAEGVGEQLTNIELPEKWYLIIKPAVHVATGEIFSNQQLTRDTSAIKVAAFFEQGGRNDCEAVVSRLYPEVKKALLWLEKNTGNAKLTGTGACVFASFADKNQAEAALNKTPTEWECFIAKGINRSPLQHLLRD